MDDEQLNVLKVIEKKPNSNLIDLNSFEQTEDKTNVRVSVLEAFDPLLIKTDSASESVQEYKDGKLYYLIFCIGTVKFLLFEVIAFKKLRH